MAELLDRNTGRGSSLQLWSLLTVVLGGAWRSRLGAPATPGVSQFCSLALARWHFIRDALTKKFKRQTSARLAFAGVRLPAAGPTL